MVRPSGPWALRQRGDEFTRPKLRVVASGDGQRSIALGVVLVVVDEAIILMGALQIVEEADYASMDATCPV